MLFAALTLASSLFSAPAFLAITAPPSTAAAASASRPAPTVELSTPLRRPLAAEELGALRTGAGAASLELDLPSRGVVTLEVVAMPVATDELEVIVARVER
ncbi:MAG: hypothetical protein ACO3QC_11950, partial [Phycisphaerales bacterium]